MSTHAMGHAMVCLAKSLIKVTLDEEGNEARKLVPPENVWLQKLLTFLAVFPIEISPCYAFAFTSIVYRWLVFAGPS